MQYLHPKALFDGRALHANRVLACEDDVVVRILSSSEMPPGMDVERLDAIISPGFFDIQVNGGGGVMLNNTPTREGVRQIAKAHNARGTAYLLPTVITDAPEIMARAALAVAEELGQNGICGIHIEGPHISPAYKGTHNSAYIRPFDEHTLSVLTKLRQKGVPVLLTLAPEMLAPGLIAKLSQMGVIVSAGHSAATAEQTRQALHEGLRCFTHLFNGMPAIGARAPMITGTAINSAICCGIIADGHHVCDDMIALACRARPEQGRMILVSDAMPTIGGPDRFDLYGELIRVQDGRLINANGSLAGAHIDLATSVQRMAMIAGVPFIEVLRMATSNPFEMMRLTCPEIIGCSLARLSRLPGKCFYQE